MICFEIQHTLSKPCRIELNQHFFHIKTVSSVETTFTYGEQFDL